MWQDANNQGVWVKGKREFFVLFLLFKIKNFLKTHSFSHPISIQCKEIPPPTNFKLKNSVSTK